ncbi:MAG: tetratricopeptide repeat protein [Planctomycetes bacterium]|nr:tetratricopeptide repeat protein [Planctomycetota bacterium]
MYHFDQEQWDQAIAELQEVIRLDPSYSIAYKFLGYSCAAKDDIEPAIEALENYLQLAPEANDRSEVLSVLEQIRLIPTIPPGQALFVFHNYTGDTWIVDIGPYSLEVPPNPPDQPFTEVTLVIEPGAYTWQAHSMDNSFYITDAGGNRGFDFSVAAGKVHIVRCC